MIGVISEKRRLLWDGRGAAHGRHRSLQGLPQSIDQFGAWAISGVCKKRYGVVVCSHEASFSSQTANIAWFCGMLSLPINLTIGFCAVTMAWTGTFGFTLSFNDGLVMRYRAVHRTAIEDHTVNGTLKQAAVERFSASPSQRSPDVEPPRRR